MDLVTKGASGTRLPR